IGVTKLVVYPDVSQILFQPAVFQQRSGLNCFGFGLVVKRKYLTLTAADDLDTSFLVVSSRQQYPECPIFRGLIPRPERFTQPTVHSLINRLPIDRNNLHPISYASPLGRRAWSDFGDYGPPIYPF